MRILVFLLAMATVALPGAATEQPPPFPNMTLTSFDGAEQVTMHDLRGRPVVVNFWASWCGPCRVEMPELQELYEDLGDDGMELVTVNMDRSRAAASRFLKSTGLSVPVYTIDQQTTRALGITSLPTTVLVAPDGEVAQVYSGYHPKADDDLRRRVTTMLAGSEDADG
jgi:thiol-disulfide isomerase/thioredoxin